MIQGECDLTIQHVSSTMSSPLRPCICKIVSVCSVLSDPVGTPVSNCKYFLKKVFPDLGKDVKAILLLLIRSPSRNTPYLSNTHLLRCQSASSFDLNSTVSCFRLRTGVSGKARM